MTDQLAADPTTTEPTVLIERRDRVAILTLNRPDRANTLNDVLLRELREAQISLANDSGVRAVVITGAGRHFCGGADLRAARSGPRVTPEFAIDFDWQPQPVVAAINGAAMGGGCEIALGCDFRMISSTAKIGLTEIRFGALPAGGGTARLPRIVGLARAKQLIMTGEPIDAQRALEIGLVDRICAPDELVDAAVELATLLAGRAPFAMRTAKILLNQSLEVDLTTAMRNERLMISKMATPDEMAAAREEAAAQMDTYAKIFSQPDR